MILSGSVSVWIKKTENLSKLNKQNNESDEKSSQKKKWKFK